MILYLITAITVNILCWYSHIKNTFQYIETPDFPKEVISVWIALLGWIPGFNVIFLFNLIIFLLFYT